MSTAISDQLMRKLMAFDGKVHTLAFGHSSDTHTIVHANEEAGYWFMFAEGGKPGTYAIHDFVKDMFLATLTDEEKEELEQVLAKDAMHNMLESIAKTIGKTKMEAAVRFGERLDDEEKRHLWLRFGVSDNEGLKPIEAVAAELGITPEQAAQNEDRIYAKLKHDDE